MRRAAALLVLLLLGFLASTAIPGRSAVPQLTISTALPTISTTLPVSTTLPKITTTLPVSTTLPKVTTTLPVSTTLPRVTTTLPVSTTLPKVTTTLPVTTALPKVTTTLPKVTTALSVTTTLVQTATSVVQKTATNVTAAASSSASSAGGGTLFQSPQAGSSSASAQPGAASALLFTASAGSPAGSSAVTSLRTSRPFLSFKGPKARRAAIIVFRLRHAGRVRFTVIQVFPLCRVVGSFTVRGHVGLNRFRFNGRVHGKRLDPGTYQIGLRTKRGRLLRVTIAIFNAPGISRSAVVTARHRNTCGSTAAVSTTFPGFTFTLQPPVEGRFATAGATSSRSNPESFLGVTAPHNVIREIGKNPFALLALGLAVLLLGVAAIPQAATPRGRMGELLVRERSVLALGGGAALAVGAIIVTLS